nr:MAG TPA: hypothetical protein [Caudoviricetes sp.]
MGLHHPSAWLLLVISCPLLGCNFLTSIILPH